MSYGGWNPSYLPPRYAMSGSILGGIPTSYSYRSLYDGGIGRAYAPQIEYLKLFKCAYCGNKWPREIRTKYINCPTCAGSYE